MMGCSVRHCVLAVVLAGAICSPALAQEEDDWEFGEDAARQLTVATVRYDAGKAVVAQCEKGELKVVIVGLPAATTGSRHLNASRTDGRRDSQGWFAPVGQTAFTSTTPGRDARFLRGGGMFELHSAEDEAGTPMRAAFDLPTQNANLDRVLAACGYAVTDDRDLLQRASDLKTEWQAEHENDRPRRPSGSRSVSQPDSRSRQAPPPPPQAPRPSDASCIVRAGVYADCRIEHAAVGAPSRNAESMMARLNGTRLEAVSAAANEGRVYYLGTNGGVVPLIVVEPTEIR